MIHRKALGRPRDPATRKAIMSAARTLFFDQGYASVNICKIARKAGVTRMTVYAYFKNKEELFRAFIMEMSDNVETGTGLDKLDIEGPLRESLVRFGTQFIGFITRKDIAKAAHLLISQSKRFPALSQLFYDIAPDRTCKVVTQYLQDHPDFIADDYQMAAEHLMSMWIGMHHMRMMHNMPNNKTKEQWENYITHSVDVFLRGYGIAVDA